MKAAAKHVFLFDMPMQLGNTRCTSWIQPKKWSAGSIDPAEERGKVGAMYVEESGGMVKETPGHSAITIAELNLSLTHPCCRTKQYRRLGTKVGECRGIFGSPGKPATPTEAAAPAAAVASGPGTGLP